MNIEIDDRLYNDIELYCKANSLNTNDYITDIIREKHFFIKYGDLNTMMEKAAEQSTAEVKKRVKKAKKTETVAEQIDDAVVEDTSNVQENKTFNKVEQDDSIEQVKIEEPKPKVQRKKRTLKTL